MFLVPPVDPVCYFSHRRWETPLSDKRQSSIYKSHMIETPTHIYLFLCLLNQTTVTVTTLDLQRPFLMHTIYLWFCKNKIQSRIRAFSNLFSTSDEFSYIHNTFPPNIRSSIWFYSIPHQFIPTHVEFRGLVVIVFYLEICRSPSTYLLWDNGRF